MKPSSTLAKFFSGLARVYRTFRSIILNLVFILIVLVFLGSLLGQPPVVVQRGSALLLNPNGTIVDQLTYVDPLEVIMADSLGSELISEVLLQDILNAIELATNDADISSIVLMLNNLQPSGFSKLRDIGQALDEFRQAGKKVYAYADNYTQGQYYLAAHADEVILHNMGGINLEGFSSYQLYYREALDKLGVNVNIFRVGEYKSAVEPYERNDMSDEARQANMGWLGDLWEQYVNETALARGLEPDLITDYINSMDQHLREFNGDQSQLVLARNLVDSVMSRNDINAYLRDNIGPGDNGEFLYVGLDTYLSAREGQLAGLVESNDRIGLIVASGTIYDGRRRAGEIGGDSLQELIHRAREDENVKALVLRIDSGGGSAFASEVIRSELARFKAGGKPLVVSMGSVAASGGYWISTPADEIWASASTITGSIGIFGLYPTFEESFDMIGLNTDGVGTTAMSGAFALGRELPPLAANVLQLTLEDGYNRFINLVAESRDMTTTQVDAIARGRVWSGEDAFTLGLVDQLGDLDDAIASAAALANLESYDTRLIQQPLTPVQQLLRDLAGNALVQSALPKPGLLPNPSGEVSSLFRRLTRDIRALLQYNDPNGLYLQCQECLGAISP